MIRQAASAICLLLLVAQLSWTQSDSSQQRHVPNPAVASPLGAQSRNGAQEDTEESAISYSEVLTPPSIITGERAPLSFASEIERSNFITGRFHVVSAFDDNVYPGNSQRLSDFSYLLAPAIEINKITERWRWNLNYAPGFTVNQRFNELNQSFHNLDLRTTYRFSPHVALRIRDDFEKTNTLFSGVLDNPQTPGFGPLQQANRSVIAPAVSRMGNTSSADLSYQFSRSSMIGGGATYYFVNYADVAPGSTGPAGLLDTRSLSTGGFYAHRFNNRQWTGGAYKFQRLNFDFGEQTLIHRFLYFYQLPFNTNMMLSVWGGPEYSITRATEFMANLLTASSHPRWSGTGGLSYEWSGQHTSFRAGYARMIADGGGLGGTVTLQEASGAVRHRFRPRWTANFGVAYSTSDPLNSSLNTFGIIRTLSANAGIGRQLRDNLELGVAYGRDRQESEKATLPSTTFNRNRAWLSLSYSLTRALGR